MHIVWLIAALLGIYLIFILLPSVICFFVVLSRKDGPPFRQVTPEMPFYDAYMRSLDRIRALPWETVRITAWDGTLLCGHYLDRGAGKTALCLHGYRGTAWNNFCLQGELLLEENFNLLLITQRAHEDSGGRYTGLGLLEQEDLLCWLDWLKDRPGGERVLLYGMSMGASAAAYASDRLDAGQVRAMVIDCGFLSPEEQLSWDCRKRHIPWRLMRVWIRLLYRQIFGVDIRQKTSDSLRRTQIPALFLHGGMDTTVPIWQGEENYTACASEKDRLFVPEAIHTLSYAYGGEEAKEKLLKLIRRFFSDERRQP